VCKRKPQEDELLGFLTRPGNGLVLAVPRRVGVVPVRVGIPDRAVAAVDDYLRPLVFSDLPRLRSLPADAPPSTEAQTPGSRQ
jgi:hypothetical protein